MITKKTRFEVFKRDGFQCAYCGRTPPEITLEIDHIEPISKGGKDDMENLLTSCFDCNRGKKNIRLDKIPTKLEENIEVIKEKEEQYKEYKKLLNKIEKRIQKEINEIDDIYNSYFPEYRFSEKFKELTIKRFLNQLSTQEIKEAIYLACDKTKDSYRSIPYFCGICWNKIKKTKPPYKNHK